ncbi:hypothetical protein L9W92_00530 [Pelotomaculum terephthalicicum JT]|uniref:hypothetical protein n=1 Tax=Pelotomaculum terephthalicicum TaxID=206393 RepID=UPI001F04E54B|nr:hypothetical protein [Pelotomaculum terephthalicicum]MCG9966543.1 hypothetical protein [Pelotomaculum terephthalicicum JT]
MLQSVDTYWNPFMETMPLDKLKEMQLTKFKKIFKWGYEHSRLYRGMYEEAGLRPDDIKTWDDVLKVPMLEKDKYRKAQAKQPWPYGDALCAA